jgi:hypothetical protein
MSRSRSGTIAHKPSIRLLHTPRKPSRRPQLLAMPQTQLKGLSLMPDTTPITKADLTEFKTEMREDFKEMERKFEDSNKSIKTSAQFQSETQGANRMLSRFVWGGFTVFTVVLMPIIVAILLLAVDHFRMDQLATKSDITKLETAGTIATHDEENRVKAIETMVASHTTSIASLASTQASVTQLVDSQKVDEKSISDIKAKEESQDRLNANQQLANSRYDRYRNEIDAQTTTLETVKAVIQTRQPSSKPR